MVKDKQPDIFLTSGYTKDALMIVRQAREVDLNVKMMAFTVGVMLPEFLKSLGRKAIMSLKGSGGFPP